MDEKRILVAVEMKSYRECLAEAFREFCPNTDVFEARPEDLDAEVGRLHPSLVLCSHATDAVRSEISNWVELYPDPLSQESEASIGGKLRLFAGIQLADLFAMVDQIDDEDLNPVAADAE